MLYYFTMNPDDRKHIDQNHAYNHRQIACELIEELGKKSEKNIPEISQPGWNVDV